MIYMCVCVYVSHEMNQKWQCIIIINKHNQPNFDKTPHHTTPHHTTSHHITPTSHHLRIIITIILHHITPHHTTSHTLWNIHSLEGASSGVVCTLSTYITSYIQRCSLTICPQELCASLFCVEMLPSVSFSDRYKTPFPISHPASFSVLSAHPVYLQC